MLGSASTPEGLLKEVCPLPEPHLDDRRGGSGEGLGFLGSHVPGKEGSGSQGDLEKSWVPARTGGSEPGHRAVEPVGPLPHLPGKSSESRGLWCLVLLLLPSPMLSEAQGYTEHGTSAGFRWEDF